MLEKIVRKLGDFKGKQRISRLLFNSTINRVADIIVEGKFGYKYKIPNIKEIIGFELFINGIFEEEYIHMIISKLPLNGVFVDLGANIGSITIPVCKKRGDITTIALEASSQMVSYLNANVNMNSVDNCSIENVAIWDKHDETISFFVPQEQYGKGMISLPNSELNIQCVKTTTLDQLCIKYNINRIDLIKVDIEGFEYFAFKGGEKLLKESNAPDILFEFIASAEKRALHLESGDAQSLLMSYGYNLYLINNKKFKQLRKPMTDHYAMIYATKKMS